MASISADVAERTASIERDRPGSVVERPFVVSAQSAPLIAVVDPSGRLGRWVGTLCEMLRIRMMVAVDAASLSAALEGQEPLGVVCGDFGEDTRPVEQLIRLVSCYDRTTPLLLLTDDRPETQGAIDAATDLWPVHNVERASGAIRPDTVLAFLSRIGRQNGATRLMMIRTR